MGRSLVRLILIYLPPPVTHEMLNDFQEALAERMATSPATSATVVCGDFNIDQSEDSPQSPVRLRLEHCLRYWDLKRIRTPPTRERAHLDLLFSNCNGLGASGPPPINSDHNLVSFLLDLPVKVKCQPTYIQGETNRPLIRQALVHFQDIPSSSEGLGEWCRAVSKAIFTHTERLRLPGHCPKWISPLTIEQFRCAHIAFHRFRLDPSVSNCRARNKERALLKRRIREDRQHYLNTLSEALRNKQTKPIWREVRCWRSNSDRQEEHCTPRQREDLTTFFTVKFQKPHTKQLDFPAPKRGRRHGHIITIEPIHRAEVEGVLCRWRHHPLLSRGKLDRGALSSRELDLEDRLTRLFNTWLVTADYPIFLKETIISPIIKETSPVWSPNNFRPIAKSHPVAACFEAILAQKLARTTAHLLHDAQHGFREGRSTTTNLLEFWTSVTCSLDKGKEVHCLFLDVQGAFDNVAHSTLIATLDDLGLSDSSIALLTSFLFQRSARVAWGGRLGSSFPIDRGVPQGSPLGPLLFTLFINDLLFTLEELGIDFLCYADDLKLWREVSSVEDLQTLQLALDAAALWFDSHGLRLNPAKSAAISFVHRKHCRVRPVYKIADGQIPIKDSVKDLGVFFQADAKFHLQAATVLAAANRNTGIIRRLCRSINLSGFALLLFTALVMAKIEYAAAVWWPTQMYWRRAFDVTLSKFLRALYCRELHIAFDRLIPTNLLLQHYNVMRPSERRERADTFLMLAIAKGQLHCKQVLHRLGWHIPPRTTRQKTKLVPGPARTVLLEESFLHRASRLINRCPEDWDY